jgi:Replication-relaxation
MSTRTPQKGMSVIGYNGAMDVVTRARGRLFERPDTARPCRITPRDLAILANLARLRLASGEQLAALDGGSEQNVSRSLLALWEHDYVERLLGQVDRRLLYKGSFPIIYGLTRPGAWLLRQHGYEVRRRLLYENDKQRRAGWRFIEHRVGITDFMVRLELACRERTGLRLIERKDIVDSSAKTNRDRRVRLMAKVRLDTAVMKLSVDPDEIFGLHLGEADDQRFFMLELDRGEIRLSATRARSRPTSRKR